MKLYRYYLLCATCVLLATPLAAAINYCIPPVHEPNYTGITRVAMYKQGQSAPMFERGSTIGDLYRHHSEPIAVSAGVQYDLHLTTFDELVGTGLFTDKLNSRVWIDWNADGDFTDAGEEMVTLNNHDPGLASATLAIPDNATGQVRMRVYIDMPEEDGHDAPTPCGYINSNNPFGHHGEVEDYTLEISSTSGVRDNTHRTVVCRPNPCTERVFIPLSLGTGGVATIVIYDAFGREVARPVDGIVPPGEHTIEWKPGSQADGIYYYRIQTEEYTATGSVVLHR